MLPATDLENDIDTRSQLKFQLNAILGQTIELCIMAYTSPSDPNTIWFQLFATEMTEECKFGS